MLANCFRSSLLFIVILGLCGLVGGCSQSTVEPETQNFANDRFAASEPDGSTLPPKPDEPGPLDLPPRRTAADNTSISPGSNATVPPFAGAPNGELRSAEPVPAPEPTALSLVKPDQDEPGIGLKPDLTPEQLVEFLATADKDMQAIVSNTSGITDPQAARKTLLQIVRMKQEASRRLADDEQVDPKLRSEGKRGQLQALSHLASLGDVKAADELEQLANENLESSDPRLVTDSQLVLIGFAIEGLQTGRKDASEKIVTRVQELSKSISNQDVPAMMIMGQARQLLANYGHDPEAQMVRDTIIDIFADSPDENIAKMAAQLAGNVRFDGINRLLNQVIDGETVAADDWTQATDQLIDEAADLQTVRYLAAAALDLESRDLGALVDATFEVLERRFMNPESATFKEITVASEAREARAAVIGQTLQFDLPAIDGSDLSLEDYRGKIVLMPFWTANFLESFQVLPILEELRELDPARIEILGMNLDFEIDEARQFSNETKLEFQSFFSKSSADGQEPNPVAVQFGMVSMPFVAIIDQQGRVAALDFNGRKLKTTVERLLAKP